jgi:hypothetical protein
MKTLDEKATELQKNRILKQRVVFSSPPSQRLPLSPSTPGDQLTAASARPPLFEHFPPRGTLPSPINLAQPASPLQPPQHASPSRYTISQQPESPAQYALPILSLVSTADRLRTPQSFLHCSHLLATVDPDTTYFWPDGRQYPKREVLLAGAPSAMFTEWILHPILKLQTREIASHAEHLLDQVINAGTIRLQFAQIYSTAALTLNFFQRLYSVDCWNVSWGAPLTSVTPLHFHVYDLQALLVSLPNAHRQLPSGGLSLTQALDLGRLVYHLFALLTVCQHDRQISVSSFTQTEFGQRLLHWSQLPNQPHAQRAWEPHSAACSLHWFMNLSTLLCIYQEWMMLHRFQPDAGFLDVITADRSPHVLLHPTIKSRIGSHAPTLSARLLRFDEKLIHRWEELIHSVVQWSIVGFESHFAPLPASHRSTPSLQPAPAAKRARREDRPCASTPLRASDRSSAQFVSAAHVFDFVDPTINAAGPMATIRAKLTALPVFPQLEYDGKPRHICFHSSFSPPYHKCNPNKCNNRSD